MAVKKKANHVFVPGIRFLLLMTRIRQTRDPKDTAEARRIVSDYIARYGRARAVELFRLDRSVEDILKL